MEERRKAKREPVQAIFSYELQGCSGSTSTYITGTAIIHDISMRGARVRTVGQQLPKGTRLRAMIMALGGEVIEVVCRVAWSRQHELDTFDAGIQFLEYEHNSEERLQKHIDKLQGHIA